MRWWQKVLFRKGRSPGVGRNGRNGYPGLHLSTGCDLHPCTRQAPVTAVLLVPDATLSRAFQSAAAQTRLFEIVAEFSQYLPLPTLEIRLKQFRPVALIVDLHTDPDAAAEAIRVCTTVEPPVVPVALDFEVERSKAIYALRRGAAELLVYPFTPQELRHAAKCIRRLGAVDHGQNGIGQIIAFASTKPGSGASTLAAQFAFQLSRKRPSRILLLDMDFSSGAISFYTGAKCPYSFLDLMECHSSSLLPAGNFATSKHGIDILPAPPVPKAPPEAHLKIKEVLEHLRRVYEFVVIDLPPVFDRLSLLVATEADRFCMVFTPDLTALHVTLRALQLASSIGLGTDRFEVVLNRDSRRQAVSAGETQAILGRPVSFALPEDPDSLLEAVASGKPLDDNCLLGTALARLAEYLTRSQTAGPTRELGALSQSTQVRC